MLLFATFTWAVLQCAAGSEITGLALEEDGSYHAQGLHDGHFSNATCTAGGYRDFYIDATVTNEGHDNLFVEAIYTPGDDHKKVVALDVLSIHMFYEEIPFDRDTENTRASSPDGVYSLAVGLPTNSCLFVCLLII